MVLARPICPLVFSIVQHKVAYVRSLCVACCKQACGYELRSILSVLCIYTTTQYYRYTELFKTKKSPSAPI